MLFSKSLSSKEITRTIEKIREQYNHYIVRFGKNLEMKRRFENRLMEADQKRKDMTLFLGVEVQIVSELIQREEEKQRQEEIDGEKPTRIQKQISSYPSLTLHPEASEDVEKLYGTLQWFHGKIWEELKKGLIKRLPQKTLRDLEMELEELLPYKDQLPKEILHYQRLLSSPTATLSQVSNQQNALIKTASFFLHRLYELVLRIQQELNIQGVEGRFYDKTLTFLKQTILDFRLKDLRPQE